MAIPRSIIFLTLNCHEKNSEVVPHYLFKGFQFKIVVLLDRLPLKVREPMPLCYLTQTRRIGEEREREIHVFFEHQCEGERRNFIRLD